jgi:DNA-binding MltR family transcriptional regulator
MDDDLATIARAHWNGINDVLEKAPNWIDRGQAATVLKTIAIFEDVLQECVQGCMRPLTSRMRARLFDGYGPISTLAAKADIAYALNLLNDEDYADLQIIRKIRNEFAHSREVMGFEKPKIEELVSRMQRPHAVADTAYRWYFARLVEIGHRLIEAAAEVNQRLNQKPKSPRRKTARRQSGRPKPSRYFSLK